VLADHYAVLTKNQSPIALDSTTTSASPSFSFSIYHKQAK
jgi:hypothetical protein